VADIHRNFADDIMEAAANEPIEAIVIGDFGCGNDYDQDATPQQIAEDQRGVMLSWEEARRLLSYGYDSDYGIADCHAIYAWTANRVIYVLEYDGSTQVESVPRNPVATYPSMSGRC
jgi:hypothetical protein